MPDTEMSRDDLGRLVRNTWISWVTSQPNANRELQTEYDNLPEPDKELGRLMGEAVASRFRDEMDQLRIQRDESHEQAETFRDLCRRTCAVIKEYWWGYPMTAARAERVSDVIRDCRVALGLESEDQVSTETEGGGA